MTGGAGRGLVLFFTYRVSLATWAARGLLDREVELYRRLLPAVGPVTFVTYGGPDDSRLPVPAGIRVLPNRWGLPAPLMSLLAPLLYRREIREAAVLKTNQASGAWTAVLAKWITGRPLLVRCGYVWSVNHARESRRAWRSRLVFHLERAALRAADRVAVTSGPAREYLLQAHGLDPARVVILPNHVDPERFAPGPADAREPGLVGFVGRLEPEKNVESLVRAAAGLPGTRLVVAGDGPLRPALTELARGLGLSAEFLGAIPNARLPELLGRLSVFVLPSRYEWSPKSLLEAMAAGVPVLAADVPGIRDLVRHGETGWLAPGDPEGLRDGLARLLGDAALRERLGKAGRRHVLLHHAIEPVVERERSLLLALAAGGR